METGEKEEVTERKGRQAALVQAAFGLGRGKRQAQGPRPPWRGTRSPAESCLASFSLWSRSSKIAPGHFPPRPVCPGAGVV